MLLYCMPLKDRTPVNSRETYFIYREGELCGGYYLRERIFLIQITKGVF